MTTDTRIERVGDRNLLWASATRAVGPAGVAPATSAALAAALAALAEAGVPDGAVVRSRVRTARAADRAEASRVRHEVLAGPLRAASASFVDHGEDPSPRVTVELAGLLVARAPAKSIVERRPPGPTCQWVQLCGLRFWSGLTDDGPEAAAQLDGILATYAALAGADEPVHTTVFHDRRTNLRPQLVERLRGPVGWVPVDGFSAPSKTVEVEFTLAAPR